MTMTREQAIDLDNNPNFVALKGEMDKCIRMESEKLLHCTKDELHMYQERIKALKFAIRFPQLIADREEDNEPSIITPGAQRSKKT